MPWLLAHEFGHLLFTKEPTMKNRKIYWSINDNGSLRLQCNLPAGSKWAGIEHSSMHVDLSPGFPINSGLETLHRLLDDVVSHSAP